MPYFFGLGPGHVSAQAKKIAAKHGATLINYTEPNGYKRHWAECHNAGEPFDGQKAQEVRSALQAKGIAI